MGLIKGLFQLACTPIAVAKDVVTLGTRKVICDEDQNFTEEHIDRVEEAFRD